MKKLLFPGIALLFLSLGVSAGNPPASNWQYTSDTDQMSSTVTINAINSAKEKLQFSVPYDGGATASLVIRHDAGGNGIIFMVSKGQMVSQEVNLISLKLRFDNNPPEIDTFAFAGGGMTNVVLMGGYRADKLIEKIKKAQKVLVQASYFNDGDKIASFDVSGLKWNPTSAHVPPLNLSGIENGKWQYETDTDKMTSALQYYATIPGNKLLDFSFPYNGGSTPIVTLQNVDSINAFIFAVSKGQIVETPGTPVAIAIRFDNDTAATYAFQAPSDGNTTKAFIGFTAANKLIARMKTAKIMKVEAQFYSDGYYVAQFNIGGLNWNHYGKEGQ